MNMIVSHFQWELDTNSKLPVRAYTLVSVRHGQRVYVGVAKCSEKDQFNKKFGVALATERANLLMKGVTPTITARSCGMQKYLLSAHMERTYSYFKDVSKFSL